jgi:hypothetical protein
MENISNPSPRLKLRIVIPAILIGAVTSLLLLEIIRGNWTDAEPKNPASAADGIVTQIIKTPEGHKEVRGAVIVNARPENVWKVVTNYDQFSSVFPNISASKGTQDADGRWHLTGEFHSIAGRWPMDVHVRHSQEDGNFDASWDEPTEAWKINRGSWDVKPHGTGETLLVYNLELRVLPFPDSIVRAILLDQIKPAMKAVADHAQGNQPPR